MTGELDIRTLSPKRRYTPTETARILGCARSSLYRYYRGLEYNFGDDGKRFYTGFAIAKYWNTVRDSRGREVTIDPDTGEARPAGKSLRRTQKVATTAKQTL